MPIKHIHIWFFRKITLWMSRELEIKEKDQLMWSGYYDGVVTMALNIHLRIHIAEQLLKKMHLWTQRCILFQVHSSHYVKTQFWSICDDKLICAKTTHSSTWNLSHTIHMYTRPQKWRVELQCDSKCSIAGLPFHTPCKSLRGGRRSRSWLDSCPSSIWFPRQRLESS